MSITTPHIHRPLVLLALAGVITGCAAPSAGSSAPPTSSHTVGAHASTPALPGAYTQTDAYGNAAPPTVPVPAGEPALLSAPPAQRPELGALHLIAMDGAAPGATKRVRAGTTVQLYVGQIHNVQHVTFLIQRGDAQPEVLDYADVLVPGLSTDGGASIFWRAEAGYPTVYLRAEAHDDAGAVAATQTYALTIDP